MIESLLKAIPDSDENCNLKRAEIRRWARSCKMPFNKASLDFLSVILQESGYWNGYKLINRIALEQRVLNDPANLADAHVKFKLACLLCSGEKVLEYFIRKERGLGRSIEDLVTSKFHRLAHTKLENFWSHYANIVDVPDASPVIVDSFKKMMDSKGLNYNDQNDIWKYGFLCAKEVGSIDAMDFFFNKFIKDEEKDQFLIDTIKKTRFSSTKIHSDNMVLEFCIERLNCDKYGLLINQEIGTRGCMTIFGRLIDINLYEHIRKLASCVTTNGISNKEYTSLLYCIISSRSPVPEESRQHSIDLFIWLWKFQNLKNNKCNYLDNLDSTSSLTVLEKLVEINELSVYKMIIDDASPEQFKKALITDGHHLCRTLYQRNERILLSEALSCVSVNMEFLNNLDIMVYSHVVKALGKQKSVCPDETCKLYKEGKREELLKYVQPVVKTERECDLFLHDIDVLVSHKLREILDSKREDSIEVSSSLCGTQSTSAARKNNRR